MWGKFLIFCFSTQKFDVLHPCWDKIWNIVIALWIFLKLKTLGHSSTLLYPALRRLKKEDLKQPGIHNEFKASLDYIENLSQKKQGLGMTLSDWAACTICIRLWIGAPAWKNSNNKTPLMIEYIYQGSHWSPDTSVDSDRLVWWLMSVKFRSESSLIFTISFEAGC